MRFMRYCPWCRRKVHRPWPVPLMPEKCSKCRGPVDTTYWKYCPWCREKLI
jgi:ribosomal protein L33